MPLNEDYSYDNEKNGEKKTAIKNDDKKISKKTIQNYKKILDFYGGMLYNKGKVVSFLTT